MPPRRPARHRVGDDYAAHGHDQDGATAVIGDEPMHFRERRPSATGGKGFEGAEPLARSQCADIAWAGSLTSKRQEPVRRDTAH